MTLKPKPPIKRIPDGTRVTWKARYDTDPVNEGVVQRFVPKGAYWSGGHRSWDRNLGGAAYLVLRDRTPAGLPKATPDLMRPYASRLEAQNKDLLQVVK